jgi:hypothetical protein
MRRAVNYATDRRALARLVGVPTEPTDQYIPPEAFVSAAGEEAVVSEKARVKDGGWRYGFTTSAKPSFARHVEEHATASDLGRFGEVWRPIGEWVTKLEAAASRRAAA